MSKLTDRRVKELFKEHGVRMLNPIVTLVRAIEREVLAASPAAESAVRDRVIKECAEVCYEYAIDQWNLYKGRTPYTGRESGRADPDVQGRSDGAEVCAERIRALKTAPTTEGD